jgi:hypothetical protein
MRRDANVNVLPQLWGQTGSWHSGRHNYMTSLEVVELNTPRPHHPCE